MRRESHTGEDMLRSVLERSLGPWSQHAPELALVLERHGLDLADLEPSLRGGAGRKMTGRRMMIEHVTPGCARDILTALRQPLELPLQFALEVAASHRQPSIVGWDAGGDRPCVKLYVNCSDASAFVRSQIAQAVVGSTETVQAPHVLGWNVDGDGRSELKVYEQVERIEGAPRALVEWAEDLALAGIVRSCTLRQDTLEERGWFVSPRSSEPMRDRLGRLPGWDDEAVADLSPFEAGPVTSVGFSQDGTTWTVYFKPDVVGALSWKLDPDVCVSTGSCEIGIYVEPTQAARRAYHRAGRHAVSYRMRQGRAESSEIEELMSWAVARIIEDEETGGGIDLTSPPEPWHVVRSR